MSPNPAPNLPPPRRARTRREATASIRLRALTPPSLPKAPAQDEEVEDTRGWLEAHFERLVAFAASAAIAAAVVSRLLPSAQPSPKVVVLPPMVAQAPAAAVAAPPAAEAEVVVPEVVQPPPTETVAPPPTQAVAETVQVSPIPAHKVRVAAAPASQRHAKARSHRTLAHAAEARSAPTPATPVEASAPSSARAAYARGDLETAERLLRKAGHVGQADRVASVARYLSEAGSELREHDEAPATRDFESAARADRALGFGAGKISRDVSRQVGLLHVAAGLRARRSGNDAGARREFEAAHRADPSNSRASIELQSQDDSVQIQDAIDPD